MASHHSNILATDIKNVSIMYETCNNFTLGYRIQNILVYMTVHLFKMMPCITGILHTLHC